MKIDNPQLFHSYQDVLKWAKSVYKALTGGLELAIGAKKDATGAYNTFTQDNFNGIMVRVGAHGTANTYTWSAVTGIGNVVIKHGLQNQPVGFIVCDLDKAATISRSTAPDKNQITLATTDSTANATVFIF